MIELLAVSEQRERSQLRTDFSGFLKKLECLQLSLPAGRGEEVKPTFYVQSNFLHVSVSAVD